MDPMTIMLALQGTKLGADFLGGLLGGRSNAQLTREQLRQQAELAREQMELQKLLASLGIDAELFSGAQNRGLTREQMGQTRDTQGLASTQMDPLTQQRSRGQFAMMSALMGNARPMSVSAPPGMGGFVPKVTGGARIPEGGFGPDVMKFFTPGAAANAEGAFHTAAAPFTPPPDLTKVGYGAAGAAPTANAQAAHAAAQERYKSFYESDFARSQAQRQALMSALVGKPTNLPRRPRQRPVGAPVTGAARPRGENE